MFCERLSIEWHGDGDQARDFTFVSDIVAANRIVGAAAGDRVGGRVFANPRTAKIFG